MRLCGGTEGTADFSTREVRHEQSVFVGWERWPILHFDRERTNQSVREKFPRHNANGIAVRHPARKTRNQPAIPLDHGAAGPRPSETAAAIVAIWLFAEIPRAPCVHRTLAELSHLQTIIAGYYNGNVNSDDKGIVPVPNRVPKRTPGWLPMRCGSTLHQLTWPNHKKQFNDPDFVE